MGGGRCPGVRGLVGGQVLVRGERALVWALSSVLTHSRALEPHRGGGHGLSVSGRLEQTLVAPLTHRGFMRTLLWWDGVSVWAHLSPMLWPDARVQLPCVGGDVRLVLGVRSRHGGLGWPLLMGHAVRRGLHGVISGYVRGSGESCARRSALGWRSRGSQTPQGGQGRGRGVRSLSWGCEVGLSLGLCVVEVHRLALGSRLLHGGRVGLVWSRGVSLTLRSGCGA